MSSGYRDDARFEQDNNVNVSIEAPTFNSRKITANIIINSSMENVWSILTDYNNLATHVPNLVQSYLIPVPEDKQKLRLFQEGAQKIIGFDFRASLIMDMLPVPYDDNLGIKERVLGFALVDSRMFRSFDGTWSIRTHSRYEEFDPMTGMVVYKYNTKLTYSVFVAPKGPVPVIALEWRIREDIPYNLKAVKVAAEKLSKKEKDEKLRDSRDSNNDNDKSNRRGVESRDISRRRVAWANDETLGSYMIPPVKKDRLNSMVQSMKMMETKGMMEIMKTNDNNDI